MTRHFRRQDRQAELLPSPSPTDFGAVGTPTVCVDRLATLVRLGLDRLAIVGPDGRDRSDRSDAEDCFITDVDPHFGRPEHCPMPLLSHGGLRSSAEPRFGVTTGRPLSSTCEPR